jgi:hypothetical protein
MSPWRKRQPGRHRRPTGRHRADLTPAESSGKDPDREDTAFVHALTFAHLLDERRGRGGAFGAPQPRLERP